MLVAFPAPVLSVTADAVRELEGSEALSGLWTLFTKCKESLKDGRRLENISWRLWYRELMLAGPPSEKKPVGSDGDGDYRPLTPTLDLDERGALLPIPMHPSNTPTCKPSSIRRSSSVSRATTMRVGKVIYDMLPPTTTMPRDVGVIATLSISPSNPTSGALPTAATPPTNPTGSEPRSLKYLSILPLLPLPEPTTTREAVISATESLPTPAMEDVGSGYVRVISTTRGSSTSTATTQILVNETRPGQGVHMVYAGPPSPSLSDAYALAHPGEVPLNFIQSSAQTSSLSSSIMPAMALVYQPPSSTTSPLPSANPLPSTILPPSPSTHISIQTPTPRTPPPPTLVVVNPTPNPTPHPTPPATPAPVLLGAGAGGGGERRAHGQYLTLPGRAGGSVRASGEGQMSAGEVQASSGVEAQTKVDVRKDDVEARVRKDDDAQFEDQDADAGRDKVADSDNNKPYQHHQKYNSTSSTSSHASSSLSVLTATTGVTSASPSDVDVDEAKEQHGSKVVNQEEEHVISSQGGIGFTSSRDDCTPPSPSPSPSPAEASHPSPKSTSTNGHFYSPTPSQLRSSTTTTTTTTTTACSRALHSAPATAITRRASGGGGGATSRSRSRPSLSGSGAPTSAKSKSRSRSRDAGGGGGLALGMTKKLGGGGGAGGGRVKLGGGFVGVSRGKLGGKGLSRKGSRVDVGEGEQGEEEREALNVRAEKEFLAKMREKELIQERESRDQPEGEREREKKSALFNIGSNSDNGSKSAGSGSDASGLAGGVHEARVQGAYELAQGTREGAATRTHEAAAWKGKGKEREVDIREEEQTRVHRDKANQKEKDNYKAKQKEREEATAAAVAANLALAAQQLAQLGAPLLPQQLAAPLLPQQQRRTIVLATSESDYETDSDDEGDGSWSSEEMSGDENVHQVEVKHVAPPPPPPPPPPAPAAPPIVHRIAPIQKTVSNYTTTRTAKPLSRAQIHRAQAQANTQAIMEKAAAEAQRQRDMFAKMPVTSFQNLGRGPSRTRSAGLLTQLLNPPLEIFPANHPYRRGYSSGEIRAGQQGQGQQQQQKGQASKAAAGPSNAPSGPARAPGGIQVSKSAAALPISSQVQVGSVYGKGVALAAMHTVSAVVNGNGNVNANGGGYRPKGRPQGQELEDDSGSEDEANAGIQVSKSVAQERLKALAQRRGIVTHGKQKSLGGLTTVNDNVVPPWALGGPQPPPSTAGAYGQLRRQVSDRRPYPEEHPPTPTPIPVGHPYNLPPPAAPSTPRTTRRQMLQTEMSESLRRNLLWERQVSKVNLVGYRASTNGGGRNNVLAGLKPLTTTPSMVQLRAKGEVGTAAAAGPSNAERTKSSDRDRRGSGGGGEAEEREERRRLAIARNKSWADDYHFKGW